MTQSENSIAIASSTSQLPRESSLQQADQAISEFERSNLPSFWPALNKTQIIAEMRSRIYDPFQVNQGGQPFCGPAAVTFALSTRRPLRYVEICRHLWENGVISTTLTTTSPNRLYTTFGTE